MPSDLTKLNAAELVHLIRTRQVSPVDVVAAYLERIEAINPSLNAIVTLASDAMERARKAESQLSEDESIGPLHGLPITIKDTIETEGLRTTSGSRRRADFIPTRDAPAVALLKSAGAIVLGKTNAAEMAMDYNADNPLFGRTVNPYDAKRTPGGSSGGEAAGIASGLSPAGLGSDLAGSIRIPAHFCGVVGLKPSTGRVPGAGQFPPSSGPYSLGAVIGPMARRVADVELLFNVLTQGQASRKDLSDCRVAYYLDDGVAGIDDAARKAVRDVAGALNDAGLHVEERRPPAVDRGYELWLKLFSRASVVQLRNVYAGHQDEGGAFVRWRLATADDTPPPTLDEYIQNWMERDRLREELLEWMRDVPLIVCPVGATNALEHDATKVTIKGTAMGTFKAFSYCQAFNVFDLPALSVPAGFSAAGLPVGVQIVGRPFEEHTVLAAASIVENALGGWRMPQGFGS